MLKNVILLGIIASGALCVNLTQYSQNDYILVSERFELIENNESILHNPVFKNFKYNRTHYGVNASGTWKVDLHGPLMMTVQAYKFASNEYRLFPMYFPFDLCDVLKRNIFGIQNMYDCGHMFRCPIKKGYFNFCNWGPDYNKFPPRAPRGRYMLVMEWTSSEIKIVKYKWYAAIRDAPLPY